MGHGRTRRAVEVMYRERFAHFERVARAITLDRELAREAVQDAFADALRAAGQWDGRGALEAWVWRCVVNRAKRARRSPLELLGEPPEIPAGGGSVIAVPRVTWREPPFRSMSQRSRVQRKRRLPRIRRLVGSGDRYRRRLLLPGRS